MGRPGYVYGLFSVFIFFTSNKEPIQRKHTSTDFLFLLGYSFQRAFLSHKYESPETSHQLWTTSQLRSSTYPVGTQITDHFEVVEHTPTRIIVRCGDTPLNRDVRASDGLFEISAVIKPQENVAEFGLKSVFYQGEGKADGVPMPPHIDWLHKQYTKLWMETALLRILR